MSTVSRSSDRTKASYRTPPALVWAAAAWVLCFPLLARANGQEMLRRAAEQERSGQLEQSAEIREGIIPQLVTDEEQIVQWLAIADLYARTQRPERERRALAKALELLRPYDPRYAPTAERVLQIDRFTLRCFDDSVELLETLLADTDPGRGNVPLWFELVLTRHQLGKTDYARRMYQRLLRSAGWETPWQREIRAQLSYCAEFSIGKPILNENLETSAVLAVARARLRERKWEEAARHIALLIERYPDAVMPASGVAGIGPRAAAMAVLGDLPPPARRDYEDVLSSSLEDVVNSRNADAILRFRLLHPWPRLEYTLSLAAGQALFQDRRFERAAAFLRTAAAAAPQPDQRQDALVLAARAAAYAGAPLPQDLELDRSITVAGESLPIRVALAQWQADGPALAPAATRTVPLTGMTHSALRLHQAPLALRKWEAGWSSDQLKDRPHMTNIFAPYVLAGDRRQVFINTSEMLYAIDPVNETLLWARGPSDLFVAELVPPELKHFRLRNSPKQFYTAVSPELVYFRLNWAERTTGTPRSAIFAAGREDGVLRWSSEWEPTLAGLRFVSDPAYADGVVVAAAWEPREIPVFQLVGLDGTSGELLWRVQLWSGTMFPALRGFGPLDSPLGAPPPAIHQGNVYFTDSAGVVVRVDLQTGQAYWFQTYPRTTEYGPAEWAGNYYVSRPYGPPLVRGNQLLIAPRDVDGVLFFDTRDGTMRARYHALGFSGLFGATDRLAFITTGNKITALSLDNAQVAWQTPIDAATLYGLPSLSSRGILCGTNRGLFVLTPESGAVIDHLPPVSWDPLGNPLDLGDRVLAVSPVTLHVFAEHASGGSRWNTPRTPAAASLDTVVKHDNALVQWTLPAADRGDFFLSRNAPELMVIRTWETFELRRTAPVPTLLWEFPGPPWPRWIQFDTQSVVFDYTDGRMIAVDVGSGRARWDIVEPDLAGSREEATVVLAGDLLVRSSLRHLRAYDVLTGATRWRRDFPGRAVRGICPQETGIGVFVEGKEALALLLSKDDGSVLRQIILGTVPEGAACATVSCVRADAHNELAVQPIAVVNHREIVSVDLAGGQLRRSTLGTTIPIESAILVGDTLCLSNDSRLVGAVLLPDLTPCKVRAEGPWHTDAGIAFVSSGPRIIAQDLRAGTPLWQSRAFRATTRLICASGETVLVAQETREQGSNRSRVAVLDRGSGEVIQEVETLAREFHRLDRHLGSIYASDFGYLYRFSPPEGKQTHSLVIRQDRADVDAIAAVAVARDQERQRFTLPPFKAIAPAIDGNLVEWGAVESAVLRWPDNWRPDHVLLAPRRPRRPKDDNDCSARAAFAQDAKNVYVAVQVNDDIHEPSVNRPLWRGDSVQVIWRGSGPLAGTWALSAALVHQVPCLESGLPGNVRQIAPAREMLAPWLQTAFRELNSPWLRRWQNSAEQSRGVRFAAQRDEVRRETTYELAIPAELLPAVRDGTSLLFDLLVHDADNEEREGALELGTSALQLELPVGYAVWPAHQEKQHP